MYSRVFDEDPITKSRTIFHHDGENITLETISDYTDVVEFNKASHNSIDERARWGSDLNHCARIPLEILFDLKRQGILGEGFAVKDNKRFRAWLNDSDNKAWRTRPGRI